MDACEFPLTWLATTHSTNTLAMQMAAEGALAWSVVAADTQTHGRGRLQRAWVSPPGSGLYSAAQPPASRFSENHAGGSGSGLLGN